MTGQRNIIIRRLAINALYLQNPAPKVTKKLFALNDKSKHARIIDFFSTHFLETREGKSTKSCKFYDDDATVKTKVSRYAKNFTDQEFLKLSKELTENLFKIMQSSSSNSDGTFFVLDIEYNNEPCIFIIKLDPKSGVQVDISTLTVRILENILPESNERVHKCAIIKTRYEEDSKKADLFVMDKQQKEGEPARFFIETFLQAQEILNDKIITRQVIREARENVQSILPEIDPQRVTEVIDREFTNELKIELRTSIKNVLESTVPVDKVDREIFIERSTDNFIKGYLDKFPDHQTTFTAERDDNVVKYRAEKNQVFFRFNRGIIGKIKFNKDNAGNDVITIDKSLGFRQEFR
ncbi:nucleoid-associated protein [Rossellomorea marisflavi]|uniref:nucleoid-associated protein n=1 Tax=Rossellomorea marisflavi TaxID=189381 RepID=UPI00345B14E8